VMENSSLIPVKEQEVLSKIFEMVADNDELKEKINFNQEMIYTLETELSGLKKLRVLDFMASDEHLCKTCREIKSTKERQLWLLNKIFNKVLFKKPKDLLHLSKLFHHFEMLVEKGSLVAKFDDLEGDKCKTCDQVLNPDTFSSKFDACIRDEINNLRGIALFAKCFEHMKLVMGVDEDKKETDQVDTIGVEPLMTRRKMSISGSPKENQANSEYTRLQDEVVELKSQEAAGGGKTRSSSVIYGQQQVAEKKDAKFVYNLGVHIKLSVYSAAPHEDPNILLRKWELELRKCGVPRADWVLFVTKNFKVYRDGTANHISVICIWN
jgi:hypothetical protein